MLASIATASLLWATPDDADQVAPSHHQYDAPSSVRVKVTAPPSGASTLVKPSHTTGPPGATNVVAQTSASVGKVGARPPIEPGVMAL